MTDSLGISPVASKGMTLSATLMLSIHILACGWWLWKVYDMMTLMLSIHILACGWWLCKVLYLSMIDVPRC